MKHFAREDGANRTLPDGTDVGSEQLSTLDELCRLSGILDSLSSEVRKALERHKLDELAVLRAKFDFTRGQIIDHVRQLARQRLGQSS